MHFGPEHLVGCTKCRHARVFLVHQGGGKRTQAIDAKDLILGVVLGEALTNFWIVDLAVFLRAAHHGLVLSFESAVTGGSTHAALERKR